MEELHEIVGIICVWLLVVTVVTGISAHKFSKVKRYVPISRAKFIVTHKFCSIGFFLFFCVHYVTAKKTPLILELGVCGLAIVFTGGIVIRFARQHYRQIIKVKAIVLTMSVLLLLAGHALVEDDRGQQGIETVADD